VGFIGNKRNPGRYRKNVAVSLKNNGIENIF
jgi:hypothetical protein